MRANKSFANPMAKKLAKLSGNVIENRATYGGIVGKCGFFFFSVVIGIALFFILNTIEPFYTDAGFTISMIASLVLIPMIVIDLIAPFIAVFFPATAPIFGSLFCLSTGYMLTCVSAIIPEYGSLVLLALIITVVLVAVLAVLYATRVVKVTQKFRAVAFTALLTMCICSLIVFLLSFIPFFKVFFAVIYNNLALVITFGLIGIIIACMFVLSDFNDIERTVTNGLDKKYEWTASFSLVFSIIWLYFKILDLILTIYNRRN